jgi:hypothetical protein
MWTGPIEITIDELFVIMGPNTDKFLSHNDSYLEIEESKEAQSYLEPYDTSNMYNIFTNQLKLKNKESN